MRAWYVVVCRQNVMVWRGACMQGAQRMKHKRTKGAAACKSRAVFNILISEWECDPRLLVCMSEPRRLPPARPPALKRVACMRYVI